MKTLATLCLGIAFLLPACRQEEAPHEGAADGSAPLHADGALALQAALDAVPAPMRPDVQTALEAAGENCPQLEQAILNAEGDARKAIAWLVARTPFRGTVSQVDLHLVKRPDATSISASLLGAHVSSAFQAWHRWPWARETDSDTFLQFVLPYRMTTEELEDWRAFFLAQEDLVASVERHAEEYRAGQDAAARSAAFRRLLRFLNSTWLASRMKYAPRAMPDLPPSQAIAAKEGRCTDLTNALIALCRTFGIAATGVRTIWWPRGDSNHYWASVWDPAARTWYDIDGGAKGPDDDAYLRAQHGQRHAKVYKVVPGEERGAVARSVATRGDESIPPLLDWYLRCLPMLDVTRDYTRVGTVTMRGLLFDRLYGIAVFNNGGLQEVCARRADPLGIATFEDLGAEDVLYFPTWFEWADDRLVQHLAGPPFVLRTDGRATWLPATPTSEGPLDLDGLPPGRDVALRRLGADGWTEVATAHADDHGRLALPRVPRETVLVPFDPKGRPIGRPIVLFERPERF